MSRITRHQMYMGIARVASQRSTCHRLNVGAIIVNPNGNIVGLGYNGAPTNEPHCDAARVNECRYYLPEAGCRVLHAEYNAVERSLMGRDNFEKRILQDHAMYTTHSPCIACAELLHKHSIKAVYFEVEYRDTSPLKFLAAHHIEVHRVLPSGYTIDVTTGQVSLD